MMKNPKVLTGFKNRHRTLFSSQSSRSHYSCNSKMDTRITVLLCFLAVSLVTAELSKNPQDLKTAESSRFFSWSGGNRYPPYSSYPNNWYHGNGYNYPNYFQYPGFGSGYPNVNYPNYGFGNNGYGGYPGGYGFQSGFGNGFNPGYGGYNLRYRNQDITQQTTARGGYIY